MALEILLGLLLAGFGLIELWTAQQCASDGIARDCGGWSILGALLFVPGGTLITATGIVLLKTRRWSSQWGLLLAAAWVVAWAAI